MKTYNISFEFNISTGPDYGVAYPIKVSVKERLPSNVDAQRYLKQRLAEEVNRAFSNLDERIDNISDEKRDESDPLVDPIPF
jgi:hypothetical protein